LSLGDSLRGGEEKVEEVKVGVLAFRGGVEEVREKVRVRRVEVGGLLGERRRIRKEIRLGRGLVEVDRRLEELEGRLLLGSQPPGVKDGNPNDEKEEKPDSHTDDEDNDRTSSDTDSTASSSDHEPTPLTSPTRLHRLTTYYLSISHLLNRLDCSSHPFITSNIHPRLVRVKNTLLLDLASALKEASARKASGERIVKILGVYRELGEGGEAVRVLKEVKKE
jgi:conserved oligomeric Golgi complex subunit 2